MKHSNHLPGSLPEQMIGGTLFIYDEQLDEFSEKANPSNKIQMKDRWDDTLWTNLFFDRYTKNRYTGGFPNGECPEGVSLANIPTIPYLAKLTKVVKEIYPFKESERNNKKHKKGRRI